MTNDIGGSDSSTGERPSENEDAGGRVSRRDVLKTSSTAAIGAAGIGAVSGTAAAEDTSNEEDELDLGVFECVEDGLRIDCNKTVQLDPWWWNGDYEPDFDVSSLGDEVLVYIHGLFAEPFAEEQATLLQRSTGFDADNVVAMKWPSTDVTYTDPWDRAAEYGRKTAEWIIDELWAQNPDTTVNVVGHSLGGRAALNMLNRLEERGRQVENVVTVGAADMARFVCDHDETGDRIYNYYDGIDQGAERVYVFYSSDDFAVGTMHELWGDLFWYTPDGEGLGAEGPTCSNYPDKLRPVDVSAEVQNHCEYYKPDGAPETLTKAVDGQL
ncbi:alpha/beta fold hydrolase [Halorientalis brevis]|uniref:Alpha/beta fold hydrolase n=1 Tax=Halorientalis brevis TaxID=1126241 RepID=A0ABD6C5S1_9EURY|nr:alpha/beta fold hydrolase [Halorientalis brevis]